MSIFLNPAISQYVLAKFSDVSYTIRGAARVQSEKLGLPQAVPNSRKMDYFFRDVFMVSVTAYMTELSYRLIEHLYTVPNLIDKFKLNRLKEFYLTHPEHLPNFAKGFDIQNAGRELPPILRRYMLGSVVKPKSYYAIPKLLETDAVYEAIQRAVNGGQKGILGLGTGSGVKLNFKEVTDQPIEYIDRLVTQGTLSPERAIALKNEVIEAKLLAHHIRRIMDPKAYIDKYIQDNFGAEVAEALKQEIGKVEAFAKMVSQAQSPTSAKEALAEIERMAASNPEAAKLLGELGSQEANMQRALNGTSPWSAIKGMFSESWKARAQAQKFAADPLVQDIKKQTPPKLEALMEHLQSVLQAPIVAEGNPQILPQLVQSGDAEGLLKTLKGPSLIGQLIKGLRNHLDFRGALEEYHRLSSLSATDTIVNAYNHEVALPLLKHLQGAESLVAKLFETLSESKVSQLEIDKIFKISNLWLKLPLSIISLFLVYGLVANKFDIQVLQPLQKKIVKARGDSKEFLMPGFMGMIPEAATFIALMKTPLVQRLGYVGSFAVAGLGALGAFALSTFLMFQYRLQHPRENPPKPAEAPKAEPTPNQFVSPYYGQNYPQPYYNAFTKPQNASNVFVI